MMICVLTCVVLRSFPHINLQLYIDTGRDPLKDAVTRKGGRPARQQQKHVVQALRAFIDRCVLCVHNPIMQFPV